MDCAKLKADIERLREARDAFGADVTEANDTGLGKKKCNEAMGRASELEDEILLAYMEDVGEHNPELFRGFHYGEKIDGFHGDISSTVKLSDNEVLVFGGGREGCPKAHRLATRCPPGSGQLPVDAARFAVDPIQDRGKFRFSAGTAYPRCQNWKPAGEYPCGAVA